MGGQTGTRKKRVVKVETAPGTYSSVAVWASREAFLSAVAAVGEARGWRTDRRRSFAAVAEVLAGAAEHRTGRDVAVSVATIGKRTGYKERTVYYRLADLRDAGLLVTVETGRHLTRDERAAVRKAGRRFIAKASTRALTHAPNVQATSHAVRHEEVLSVGETTEARAARSAKTTSKSKTRTARAPRGLAVQRLAANVERRLPSVTGGRHLGALCDVLTAAGVETWSAADVVGAVDAWHARHGWKALGREAERPLAWFASALRRALDEGAQPRGFRDAHEAAGRAARKAARDAEWSAWQAAKASPERVRAIREAARVAALAA